MTEHRRGTWKSSHAAAERHTNALASTRAEVLKHKMQQNAKQTVPEAKPSHAIQGHSAAETTAIIKMDRMQMNKMQRGRYHRHHHHHHHHLQHYRYHVPACQWHLLLLRHRHHHRIHVFHLDPSWLRPSLANCPRVKS